ncbi:MAG: hypothetical protein ACI8QS_000945 [Planctomycetota bacterium]|jgi:hypothetical protein
MRFPIVVSLMENNRLLMIDALLALREGRLHMVVGVRRVLSLAMEEGVREEPRFNTFELVDSEADPFPVTPESRALWNADALAASDERYATAVAGYEPDILKACNELLEQLGFTG